jgi:hypothetical protein
MKHLILIPILLLLAACADEMEPETFKGSDPKTRCKGHEEYTGVYNDLDLNFGNDCRGVIRKAAEACEIPFSFYYTQESGLVLIFFNTEGQIERSPTCLDPIRRECEAGTILAHLESYSCRRI